MLLVTACATCGAPAPAKACARCKMPYCSSACQAEHWAGGGHKKMCKKIFALGGVEQVYADGKADLSAKAAVSRPRA